MWFSGPASFNHEVGRFFYIIATISPDSRLSLKRPAARPWKSPILLYSQGWALFAFLGVNYFPFGKSTPPPAGLGLGLVT